MGLFWDLIMGGLSTENSSNSSFEFGDVVKVIHTGKVGVIVDVQGNGYYTVKLTDENESEYCETYSARQLKSYY